MRYVFITGTSRGLGEALLNEFKGDRIISLSRSEVDSDVQLFKTFHLDLKNESELEQESSKIFSSVTPDEGDEVFLINNAGTVEPVQSVENIDAAGYLDSYKVNVLAPALLIKAFINEYKNQNITKRILTVSSGAAVNATEGWAAYCSSKAAVNMISDVVRLESSRHGTHIESATFRPGIIDTDMQTAIRSSDPEQFPSIEKFKEYKASEQLIPPEKVAQTLKTVITAENFKDQGHYDISEYIQ